MSIVEIRHFHLFCGLGGGAKGFNQAEARVGNLQARYRCLGGVDVDPAAIKDFERLAGVPGTVLDLFTREQYIAFHGHEPPSGWREAAPDDIRRAAGYEHPHIGFTSSPCKGLSGLLSEKKSQTPQYQALNALTLRGTWLYMEAFADDPSEFFLFENVPRIQSRGRHLLDEIEQILRHFGYAVAETTHDCGELGGLAQSRKRFLLVARHVAKVSPFLYEPSKKPLLSVGDVLDKFPLPGDMTAGPMHRVPSLQFKTWLRLAFVQAGSDWRSLNRLNVTDGYLADYLIVPEYHDGYMGVCPWAGTMGAVTSKTSPSNGRFAVADPRMFSEREGTGLLGVRKWEQSTGAVTGNGRPAAGAFSVADPRIDGHHKSVQLGVKRWSDTAGVVTGKMFAGGGPNSIADPRLNGVRHNNVYRVVRYSDVSPAVTAGNGPSAGGLGVADPRPGLKPNAHHNLYRVVQWGGTSKTVAGASHVAGGALSIADPRPGMRRDKGDHYRTAGHYGVVPWTMPSYAITAHGRHDNGFHNVADPRLPAGDERLVAVIRAEDGTWHRPFTTLELAALQGLVDPDEHLELEGLSDGAWRERIGNAVPPKAAKAIAGVMGQALLLAMSGETFVLSSQPIWVRPIAVALSVAQENGL